MRETSFKAIKKDGSSWVEGDLIHEDKEVSIRNPQSGIIYPVDPATVCQNIGLLDQDQVKVWEGDIVKYAGLLFKVVWKEGRFVFQPLLGDAGWTPDLTANRMSHAKVIGSIYDKF